MLTGNKLVINDLEIDGKEELDPIVFQCLKDSGIEVIQDSAAGTLKVEYAPNENSTFNMGETEDNNQTIYVTGEEFDDLFSKIVAAVMKSALANHYELSSEEMEIPEFDTAIMPMPTEKPVVAKPIQEPGLLEQFGNSCATFFHSVYDSAHDLVCGKNENEPAKTVESEAAPRPSVR